MWDNLGRVAAELPHLAGQRTYTTASHITGWRICPDDGKPVIFFSGHIGNWELS